MILRKKYLSYAIQLRNNFFELGLANAIVQKIDLVNYQYSGNAHEVIAGIGLVNLVWYGIESEGCVPIDYRVYDKDTDGKTKNDHFREMLKLSHDRGLSPDAVVMDTWYSSLDNLKAIGR